MQTLTIMREPGRMETGVVTRAKGGDGAAWRELVRAHGPTVWAICRRLDREPEDAYQEVWEKVLRGLDRFDPWGRASVRTWIATVAHRHLVDRHRRRTVRGTVVPLDRQVSEIPGGDVALDRKRGVDRLEAALVQLPEAQRRVVVMHHVQGVPLEDVASVEEVALGTVKSRLHRGRARLAQLLGGVE